MRPLFSLCALLCCLASLLCAEWDALFSDEEDLCLFEHVNVISGHLNFCVEDAQIRSPAPLSIMRTYTSAGALERTYNSDQF